MFNVFQTVANPELLPGLILSLATLVIVLIRLKFTLTPFHICWILFALEFVFALKPMMKVDDYGRTHYYAMDPVTIYVLYAGLGIMSFMSWKLRLPKVNQLPEYWMTCRIDENLLMLVLTVCTMAASLQSFLKLGTLPMIAMAQATEDNRIGYEDVYSGFLTFLGRGTGRTLAIWLLLAVGLWRGTVSAFFNRYFNLICTTAGTLFLNAMDGQRNVVVMPFFLGAFMLSLQRRLRRIHFTVALGLLIVFYVFVGIFRMSYFDAADAYLAVSSGSPVVDQAAAGLITYTEPNLHNLNNQIAITSRYTYGLNFLSLMLPDDLLILVGIEVPDSPIEQLMDSGMLAQPGMTFRTIYADLYGDFGATGSILMTSLGYWVAIFAFNRSLSHPKYMLWYHFLAQVVICLPLVNAAGGITFIVPFLLLVVLKFGKNPVIQPVPAT